MNLLDTLEFNQLVIFVFIRLLRILKRKDNQGIKEIIRRSIQDKKTFKKYNFNYSIINKNIEDTCEKIINIIKKE